MAQSSTASNDKAVVRRAEQTGAAHQRGYRDWMQKGRAAREPYFPFAWQLEAWRKGRDKAKREHP